LAAEQRTGERGADWLAGVGEFDITPPLGVDMTGYAGRPGPADHVLDRLHVRALAVRTPGEQPIVLTCADLLGISDAMVARIREAAAGCPLGAVPPERLLLNHSHTHAGPTTAPLRAMGEADSAYCGMVVRWTVSAIHEALRRLQPARLFFGTAPTAIGVNRRELSQGRIVLGVNPNGTYDPAVYVLRVEDHAGRPVACWFSHATHPVVMGRENTGLSAEWPGRAAALLSAALGCPAVFAQGCCGDINPLRRGDYHVVQSVGRELAGSAFAAWERAEPVTGSELAGTLESVLLPQRKPSIEEAEAALSEAQERLSAVEAGAASGEPTPGAEVSRRIQLPRAMFQWAQDYLGAAQAEGEPAARMEVQALRIGDVAILATAAETFIQIGQEVQRRSPLARTVALGYSNGCIGYLPTESAFPLGGYEVETAFKYYGTLMVTPDCERLTVEAAERALHRIAP
jgi:neutral/alkaline ceramidase-like enzyme